MSFRTNLWLVLKVTLQGLGIIARRAFRLLERPIFEDIGLYILTGGGAIIILRFVITAFQEPAMPAYLYYVMAGFIVLFTVSLAFISRKLWRPSRAKRRTETTARLGELYLANGVLPLAGSIVTFIAVIAFALYVRESGTVIVASAALLAVIGYHGLTRLRLSCGWFGDNSVETEELLRFVISKAAEGGLPPGTTISDAAATRRSSSLAPSEAVDAVRA
jgi:hypothetical protein